MLPLIRTMTSFDKQRWTECCATENVRFAKKGTNDYERVMARYKNNIVEPDDVVQQDDVLCTWNKRKCWREAIRKTKGTHGMCFYIARKRSAHLGPAANTRRTRRRRTGRHQTRYSHKLAVNGEVQGWAEGVSKCVRMCEEHCRHSGTQTR